MADSIRFEGWDIIKDIDENSIWVGIHGMEKAVLLLEREARKKAPKDNGALRRSITSKVEREGDAIVGTVYTPLEYAPYVEYGTGLFAEEGGRKDVPWCYQDDEGEWHTTSGQHPQPFMRPALDENRERIKKIFQKEIKNWKNGGWTND